MMESKKKMKLPKIKSMKVLKKKIAIESPYVKGNFIIKKVAIPRKINDIQYRLIDNTQGDYRLKDTTENVKKIPLPPVKLLKSINPKHQMKKLSNSVMVKKQKGEFSKKKIIQDKYIYKWSPGNNVEAFLVCMKKRDWWQQDNDFISPHFTWQSTRSGFNYSSCHRYSSRKICFNHFEFATSMTVKANFFKNFMIHCNV